MHNPSSRKTVARNKRALFDYDITKKLTAGIVLRGHEVKSAKAGLVSLKESFIRVRSDEVWLINAHISAWKSASLSEYDPQADRKLLLSKREIKELTVDQDAKKLSLVALDMFISKRRLKVTVGVGRGRKKYDKRAKIKEREIKRDIEHDIAKIKKF